MPKPHSLGEGKSKSDKLMKKLAAKAGFPYCEEIRKYERLAKLGQGTFGDITKARHRGTRKLVVLKKVSIQNEKEGFPITVLREIKILQLLKYENVVNLIEICRSKASVSNLTNLAFFLVFDFCQHDLDELLCNVDIKFSLGEIKMVIKQLLNAIDFIHSNKIIHNDIKTANILITKSGILKLADFGLARKFSDSEDEQNEYTNKVVTLWYRPPELLLGGRNYGPPVDMWGAGCIIAEMWTRIPIMQGSTKQQQLTLISKLCGSINPETLPGVEKLDLFNQMILLKNQKRNVNESLKVYVKDPHALDLLDKLLTIDPAKRVDSSIASNHDFLWSDPLPSDLNKMLLSHGQTMWSKKNKKKNERNIHTGLAMDHYQVHPTVHDEQYEKNVHNIHAGLAMHHYQAHPSVHDEQYTRNKHINIHAGLAINHYQAHPTAYNEQYKRNEHNIHAGLAVHHYRAHPTAYNEQYERNEQNIHAGLAVHHYQAHQTVHDDQYHDRVY